MKHRARPTLLVAITVVVLAACSGGSGPTLSKKKVSTGGVTTTTIPPYVSQIAQPIGSSIGVYPSPGAAKASQTFPNPWPLDDNPAHVVPQVFLVEQVQGAWVKVLLPVRPNGTTAWVKASDVRLSQDPFKIKVELGAHRITVYDGTSVSYQGAVAVGAQATPTPTGTYYLRVLLKAPDPNTVYGPYAYGLSGHSNVLDSFNGGDGELGIHGNNDASVLGKSITHGCIRMDNTGITRLTTILPLGTPVEIDA